MLTLGQPLAPDAAQLAALTEEIAANARWSNSGPLAERLETRLREHSGWPHIAVTSSGTAALTAALLALDLPRGAEVITTPLSFRATPLAIEAAGLVPVFASVDPITLCLEPEAVRDAIGPNTAALLPVHLFGVAADPALDAVAADAGIPVVYDAAHAFGLASVVGRGTATAYSLHATKLLHTGEGGFVASTDPSVADRVRTVRNFGIDGGHDAGSGVNAKLPELSAALGLAQWDLLPAEIAARQRVRDAYTAAIHAGSRVTEFAPGHERALVMEVVRCDPHDQADIVKQLADRGILARTFAALCAPGQRYASTALHGADAAEMVRHSASAIALPLHGRVRDEHLAVVAEVLA